MALLERPVLAVVGPRELSAYGQEVLEELFRHLQHFNVVTVSGMAP
ncbi:DNA-processing protein DprA [Patescibacteria group bacterium]|nr:DNA-processing protein DprA [Patescibacteria group bacterium]